MALELVAAGEGGREPVGDFRHKKEVRLGERGRESVSDQAKIVTNIVTTPMIAHERQ